MVTIRATRCAAIGLLAAMLACPLAAATPVSEASVRAHEEALAGDALRGRGSATPDEAKAAAYVARQFADAGLKPAPGMTGYLQTALIVRTKLTAPPVLTVDGHAIAGATLLAGHAAAVSGAVGLLGTAPAGTAVLVAAAGSDLRTAWRAARKAGATLLIVPESEATRQRAAGNDGFVGDRLAGDPAPPPSLTVVAVPAATAAALAGKQAVFTLPGQVDRTVETTNAIGWLPGTDPAAKLLLVSAHLDHLGVRPDGTVMHGANDDASGTVAVIELARALAGDGRHRRGILFVCYGSEELGGFGSRWFAAHPPVPIDRIAANIEIEMIGAQDPKLPRGALMMTGYDRSNLGPTLAAHGAAVVADPYPDQHFFERSDNYQLALAGVVAHTLSGWATPPTYHDPSDTIANLDIPFMTRAIGSLVAPIAWLADGSFEPEWTGKGRPKE